MIVPSIDLMNGNAVQLIGGVEKAIDAGDPRPIADRFGLVGEIAVIDLDAALGRGSNETVIRELLKRAPCRVGGGIRDAATAVRWLDAGARKVILGTAAHPEVLRELPRERVIAALDARNGEVVTEGWTKGTGASIEARIAELREYVDGFLVTFVEHEGRMGGLPVERIERLVELAGSARVTVAGGVRTPQDVSDADRLAADAQVGMALYTGAFDLADGLCTTLRSDRSDGLWPTVVTDPSGRALGLAYSSVESVRLAIEERRGVYYSRSRNGIWKKGETSGDTQELLGISVDCDRDTLRFTVRQHGGGFCHLGTHTCFGSQSGFAALDETIRTRMKAAPAGSYTERLRNDPLLLASKLVEEACELADSETAGHAAAEAADLIYFATVAARARGASLEDVERCLDERSRKVTRRSGDAKPTQATSGANPMRNNAAPLLRRITADQLSSTVRPPVDQTTLSAANEIVNRVRVERARAVRDFAERFGERAPGDPLLIQRSEMESALASLPSQIRDLLARTADRIRTFAQAQRDAISTVDVPIPGGRAGHTIEPIANAGCYAPAGRYPLPSSVLMTVITARVAGCERIVVASPGAHPVALAAAAVAGADEFLAVGGAHAIAAMAYGCDDLDPCDVIVGPGNKWVTAAKQLVSGVVGIDMLAGPSELLIIADDSADPDLIAADLLAQAEHDADAVPMLVTTDIQIANAVDVALSARLRTLPTRETAQAALKNGFVYVVGSTEEARDAADRIAAEHVEIMTHEPQSIAESIRNAGALFIGAESAEVLGDYGAGPNHTLPTGGTARFQAGLSVMHFLRLRSWMRIEDKVQARGLLSDALDLADIEGLAGHSASAQARCI